MEYDFGAGMSSVKYDRAPFREGADQRSFRSVENGGLVFELLVGRKVFRRIRVKGGISQDFFLTDTRPHWRIKAVGFAVIGFGVP